MIRRLIEWWHREMRGLDAFRAQRAARWLRRDEWRAAINRGKR